MLDTTHTFYKLTNAEMRNRLETHTTYNNVIRGAVFFRTSC